MIDLSVIIVNYNGFKLLRHCLRTLFEFTFGLNYEVIVIDNNSTEGDVNEIVNDFDNVILVKNKSNLGFAKANNLGLNIANGKYVLFLNNDIYFTENSIKNTFDLAEKNDEKTFIGCKLLNPDKSWQPSTTKFPSGLNSITSNFFLYILNPSSQYFNKYFLQNKNITVPVEVDYILGAFLFGRRSILLKLQGFDERFFFYAEDIDLCYRLKMMGGKTLFNPTTSIVHIGGASVKSNQWFKFKNKAISELQFFQKHKNGIEFLIGIISHYIGNFIRIPISIFAGIILLNKDYIVRSYFHLKLLTVYPKNLFKT